MSTKSQELSIEPLDETLIGATDAHLARHVFESGRYGIHWLPYDPATMDSPPAVRVESLGYGFEKPAWERWSVLVTSSRDVVGHVSLKGAQFDRGLHRCELGMGIEQPYWGGGFGSKLLRIAIDLATVIDSVDWLDLHVLSVNEPAIALYLKSGFKEVSRITDFCRIDGEPMDDVFMSLDVSR